MKVWKKKYSELTTATYTALPQWPSVPRLCPVTGGNHNRTKQMTVGIKPSSIIGLRRPQRLRMLSVQPAMGMSTTPSRMRASNMPRA